MKKELKKQFFNIFFYLFLFLSLFFNSIILFAEEKENLSQLLRFLDGLPKERMVREERSLLTDYGGFGSSLLVSNIVADTEESYGTFVFAIPLDAEFAVDTAMAMVERFTGTSVNVLVAFLSGERNELPKDMGGITHKGLRDLLTLNDTPENWVICYFDADSPPARIIISHGRRGYITPLELVTPLPSLFKSHDIPWSFRIRQNTVYKLGLVEGPEALSIIWGAELNGFVLSGENDNGTGNAVSPEDLADLLLGYAGSLDFPVLNPEKHYSFIYLPGGRIFFVSELIMVTLMLVTVGLFFLLYLFYSLFNNAVLLFHVRLFFRYFLIFIIFLSLLVLSIKFSGLLYSSLTSIFEALQGTSNRTGIVLTMFLALMIFYLSSKAIDILRFPIRERFYKFAAAIFMIFAILSAIFLDFSYIPVFLWVFTFFLLGVMISSPILVFLFAFSIPLFAVITLSNIFIADNERLTELFINSVFKTPESWLAILQISLLILPVFLLAKRGTMLTRILLHTKKKTGKKIRLIIIPVLIALAVLAMIAQVILPERGIPPERRFIAEVQDRDNIENVSSSIVSLSIRDVEFQDSRIITLNLTARGNPVRFDVSIISSAERTLLPLYSASVPFERSGDGMLIKFFLGENPPNPFIIEIVVPREFYGRLETAAFYNKWDPEIDDLEKPASENYILRVSKSIFI